MCNVRVCVGARLCFVCGCVCVCVSFACVICFHVNALCRFAHTAEPVCVCERDFCQYHSARLCVCVGILLCMRILLCVRILFRDVTL